MSTFSLRIAAVVIASVFGFAVQARAQSAATDFVVMTANNEVTITGYVGAGGAVAIPSTIGGFPVTLIGQNAFYGTTSITSVIVPSGVTEVQSSAFSGCTSLASVTLPDSVTSVDVSAFSDCSALTTANLGNGLTAIGDDAFAECSALASLTLPNALVSIGQESFEDCSSLASVTFGRGLTTLGMNAFSDCSALASITLPASVTTIGAEAFYDTGMTSVNIPANVSSLGDLAFGGCVNLTSITVDPNNATYSASNGILFDAAQVTLVQVPGAQAGAFTIPNGVRTIGDHACWGCTNVTSVTIPSGVTTINMGAFGLCTGLTSMTIPAGVTSLGDQAFYGCTGLLSVTLGANMSTLGNLVFYSCSNLANAFFQGNAPTTGFYIFGATASNFVVSYTSGAQGFTSPTWTDAWGDVYPSQVGQVITGISGGGSGSGGSSPTSQTISFPAIPDQVYGTAPLTLSATASSNLSVTFRVVSGPATVSGARLTITGAGSVTVAADQAGNASYSAAPEATNAFNVNQAPQTITAFATIAAQTYGSRAFNIAVPKASSGLPVTVTVQSGPATIVGSTVTITGVGTVVLAADQAGNANYSAASETTTSFMVNGATQTIPGFRAVGTHTYSTTPFAIILPTASSGLPVTVSVVSGPATISGSSVTMTGVGTVLLAAEQAGNTDYQPAQEVTTSFSIVKASQTIAGFAPITGITYGVASFSVTAPAASSGLPVTLSIKSGPATISDNLVTITGVGTVVLAADQAGSDLYNEAREVTTNIAVGKEPQSIGALTPISNQIYGASPISVSTPTATSGLPVTVSASGAARLSNGVLTITGIGTVTVTAGQSGNATFAVAPVVTTSFVVSKIPQTIGALPSISNCTYGAAAFSITSPTATSGLAVTLKILSGPARITNAGLITITGGGTVVVAANQAGNSTIAAAPQVTTSFTVEQASQTIAPLATIANRVYGRAPFGVSAPRATSGLAVTLSILSGPATITPSGRVTVTGAGTVVVAADQAGNANYTAAAEVTTSFTVSMASQTISSFRPITGKTSTSAPFAIVLPTANSSLPVTVTVQSGPATISGNIVTITGSGTAVLAADQAGNANYTSATEVTTSFTVQ